MSKNERETVRQHIVLYKDDVEFLKQVFGGQDSLGFSKAVRETLSKYVKNLRESMNRKGTNKHLEAKVDDFPVPGEE
jgi:phage gp36-like protein